MKTTAGLWIDHRKAVIAIISPNGEETMEIKSNVEKQPGRFGGVRSVPLYEPHHFQADDSRDREDALHLNQYYEEVIAAIRDANSILIFGPGEAKGELTKRLEHAKLEGRIVAIQAADKMSNGQITAKVRESIYRRRTPLIADAFDDSIQNELNSITGVHRVDQTQSAGLGGLSSGKYHEQTNSFQSPDL